MSNKVLGIVAMVCAPALLVEGLIPGGVENSMVVGVASMVFMLGWLCSNTVMRRIKAAGNGEAIFSPKLALRLFDFFSGKARSAQPEAFPELSEREREILDLIARGLKNQEIAKQLYLSPKTVRNNVSSILHKLQVADRAEAIIRAREAGMG
jgi:DNA-binding NarL/FixJ family response regulator